MSTWPATSWPSCRSRRGLHERIGAGGAPLEYDDRGLFVGVTVRILEQRRLDRRTCDAARRAEDLCDAEIVDVDDRGVRTRQGCNLARDAIGVIGAKDDRPLERRERPGVSVDRRDRTAHHLVEPAASPD